MKMYSVYSGEYPFDTYIGYVSGDTPEQALDNAVQQFGKEFPHPVIEEMTGHEIH